jgi:cytochrome b pre-mRNA-processing protein 3
MLKTLSDKTKEFYLYNNILLLSRNTFFYTKFNLLDSFQNRIYLIFFHISFIFLKIKQSNDNKKYKIFYQKMFDLVFKRIDTNMREIGFGDMTVSKNMKFLIKNFYDILLKSEKYKKMTFDHKSKFFNNYLKGNNNENITNTTEIIDYFNKYEAFCFDLSSDSVLQGEINFNYKVD